LVEIFVNQYVPVLFLEKKLANSNNYDLLLNSLLGELIFSICEIALIK